MKTRYITCLLIIILAFCFSGCAQKTFGGKLIDADTLKPIEGAAVVAVWDKERPSPAGTLSYFKYAKESLTDKDGEWSITGPAWYSGGYGLFRLFLGLTVGVMSKPHMIYYKPGYRDVQSFSAYPYIDKEQNLEGIILSRQGETREEREIYRQKYRGRKVPFIPVKDPEKKLRNLKFSFKYPENVRTIQRKTEYVEADYVVRGFTKAETREERNVAIPGRPTSNVKKLPILNKLIQEEIEWLYGKSRRR